MHTREGHYLKDLQILLSKERLQSYTSVEEHFENLMLIARLTPKLATLEIILRNLLDNELSKIDARWIESSQDTKMQEELSKIKSRDNVTILTHHQYLSRLTLGIIIRTIRNENYKTRLSILRR